MRVVVVDYHQSIVSPVAYHKVFTVNIGQKTVLEKAFPSKYNANDLLLHHTVCIFKCRSFCVFLSVALCDSYGH